MTARRRAIIAAGILAVGLAGGGLWLTLLAGASRRPSTDSVAVELPTPRGGARRPPAFRSGDPSAEPAASGGPGPHFSHYQGRSGRLAEGLTPAEEDPVTKLGAPGQDPALEVWVLSVRVLATGTRVHAHLTDTGAAASGIPLVITSARVGYSTAPREVPTPTLAMTQQAQAAGSFAFAHAFVPPPQPSLASDHGTRTSAPRFFRYLVALAGTRGGTPFERRAGGFFYVHDPGAHLDPASAVLAPAGGDLRLAVDIEVKRAGAYFVYAELWGGPGGQQPIAFARDRLTGVEQGQRSVELRFGGRIVRDAGIDGPYVVRNLRLSQVDTHPAHEGDPIRALPPSAAWPASSFR